MEHSYELSLETLRETVLELLRLAVEYETPHAPIDPQLAASDRAIRLAVGQLSGAHAALEAVVQTVLVHRDRRRELIKAARTAQALSEVADFVNVRRATWSAEQRDRKKDRRPTHALNRSEPFRRELTDKVRNCFAWWEIPLSDELLTLLVNVVVPRTNVEFVEKDKGLLGRLADVVGGEVTRVGAATLEKISAALAGSAQSTGRFKKPGDARLALDDAPVGGSEMLGYLLRLLVARGHPTRIADAIMNVWNDEMAQIASHGVATSPALPDTPADPI